MAKRLPAKGAIVRPAHVVHWRNELLSRTYIPRSEWRLLSLDEIFGKKSLRRAHKLPSILLREARARELIRRRLAGASPPPPRRVAPAAGLPRNGPTDHRPARGAFPLRATASTTLLIVAHLVKNDPAHRRPVQRGRILDHHAVAGQIVPDAQYHQRAAVGAGDSQAVAL